MFKKLLPFAFITLLTSFTSLVRATDIRVDEDGLNGAYTTISAAIAAASDGDRIFIKPKSSDAWFIENIAINKSLTFSSDTPGTKYKIQGNITITPKSGMVVIIRELEGNTSTSINGSSFASVPANRTTVKVIESKLYSINTPTNYDLSVVKCTITYAINFTAGKIIGNSVRYITVNNESGTLAPAASDKVMIIANDLAKVSGNYIVLASNKYTYVIANNKIKSATYGIYGYAWKATNSDGHHQIINNDIKMYAAGSTYKGIHIKSHPANSELQILNNEVEGASTGSSYGIYVEANSGIIKASYNSIHYIWKYFYGITSDGTNYEYSSINNATFTDKGSLDNLYKDLNLSRNDIGVNGGSYAWTNYWNTTTARVYYLEIPKKIATGSTVKVKAEAYDGN